MFQRATLKSWEEPGEEATISIGRAIRGMKFVRCTEVVRLSESPLLEVSLYTFGKDSLC